MVFVCVCDLCDEMFECNCLLYVEWCVFGCIVIVVVDEVCVG